MERVEAFIDPSCPWAWVTSRWMTEVAGHRPIDVVWRSFCLEIRDDYGVAPTVPESFRQAALAGHALSHRMLRVMEASREVAGEIAVDALYSAWGARFFGQEHSAGEHLIDDCLSAAGLDPSLAAAADEARWDEPIVAAMAEAYRFGGERCQTPTIAVRADPPYGFKGPVMSPAPTGKRALQLWDALQVVGQEPGFFELTRPRGRPPLLPH